MMPGGRAAEGLGDTRRWAARVTLARPARLVGANRFGVTRVQSKRSGLASGVRPEESDGSMLDGLRGLGGFGGGLRVRAHG
jgi:hypothetical protein